MDPSPSANFHAVAGTTALILEIALHYPESAMNGYQITFFTQQDRRIHGVPVGEWLIALAKEMGLHGATLQAAAEGFGRSGKVHAAHFVELADQPIEVVAIVTSEEADQLLARVRSAGLRLFYVKAPVEFGTLGD